MSEQMKPQDFFKLEFNQNLHKNIVSSAYKAYILKSNKN